MGWYRYPAISSHLSVCSLQFIAKEAYLGQHVLDSVVCVGGLVERVYSPTLFRKLFLKIYFLFLFLFCVYGWFACRNVCGPWVCSVFGCQKRLSAVQVLGTKPTFSARKTVADFSLPQFKKGSFTEPGSPSVGFQANWHVSPGSSCLSSHWDCCRHVLPSLVLYMCVGELNSKSYCLNSFSLSSSSQLPDP